MNQQKNRARLFVELFDGKFDGFVLRQAFDFGLAGAFLDDRPLVQVFAWRHVIYEGRLH